MSGAPVDLRVGGQTYKVVASAPRADLERLALRVDDALRAILPPGRQASDQSFILAALALAHDLEKKEAELRRLEERSRAKLTALLARVDETIALFDGETEAAPAEAETAEPAAAEVYVIRKNGQAHSRYER